jgi:hypothetical protein
MAVISVDQPLSRHDLDALKALPHVIRAVQVSL